LLRFGTVIVLVIAIAASCVRWLNGGAGSPQAHDGATARHDAGPVGESNTVPGDGRRSDSSVTDGWAVLPPSVNWVAVTEAGEVAVSADGRGWKLVATPWSIKVPLMGVAHGADGQWIIVGDQARLATSPDALTWTVRTSAHGMFPIYVVAHNGLSGAAGRWVAGGGQGKLSSSADGAISPGPRARLIF
jgi:hypothetical protein